MKRIAAAAIGLVAAAGTASAAPPRPQTFEVSIGRSLVVRGKDPPGTPSPNSTVTIRYFPEKARAALMTGNALIQCVMESASAPPASCTTLAEAPPGYDFGAAAVGMRPYLHRPPSQDAEPIWIIPFRFELEGLGTYPTPPWVDRPAWAYVPALTEFQAAMRYAPKLRGRGWATVLCDISSEDHTSNCRALAEGPLGVGVGKAAESLASTFILQPADLNGNSVRERQILMTVTFKPV